ncbi:MAG: class I SAM-dependent methyltransferase [Methyloversatilis sp.]|jgi:cyclopropane-fatty-acyl-phospholipid synthase|uniref:Cyclopropane-fatty-acyl-phospholipid synthase n=1 Tax=Methyloversatilis universalis (strain ATCC BAA-1314 / DSM 25237 / JCM 13912 / CCUG 52030 / FAM5) TaxID=1000565 RepID=F5R7X1_METUF|nr:cyclopropane-fatty-acyl-phospholipid synthase family protein [Methyloversatilis universalis]EGK73124.1 Putative cyclopropane-fatty-acyl-phospholipid synthase [Methyloversatilis universalis FAM5]MCP4635072.1 class I SAM-dependent methyltransferase [Methyloversatilis sp.]
MNQPDALIALERRSVLPSAARHVCRLLERIEHGWLLMTLPNGEMLSFGHQGEPVEMRVKDWSVFERVIARGDIGLGEAWFEGLWDCDHLARVLTLFAMNREALESAVHGNLLSLALARLRHLARANTRSGSRRNIMAHYDLGNDFYALWLDRSMTYSSALFDGNPQRDLAAAQHAKYERIARVLRLQRQQPVIEIGCGWGGFAEVAAREFGAQVHGVTLSPAQLEWAQARAQRGGFADRATFELRDYRDLRGQVDRIVSIEMLEAVGERWWPTYFRKLGGLLRIGGEAVVQTISIADELFPRYRRGTDFIQQYVFPGGMLPSPSVFTRQAEKAGLKVQQNFRFGLDYAITLARWRDSVTEHSDALRALGFDTRFQRLWHFYLAYCEAGFRAGSIDVHQFHLVKP